MSTRPITSPPFQANPQPFQPPKLNKPLQKRRPCFGNHGHIHLSLTCKMALACMMQQQQQQTVLPAHQKKKGIKKQEGGLVYKQHTEGGGSNY
jgi:hypothetical protein